MGRRTVGVEEELFLIDPETRRPAPRARAVVEAAGRLDDSPAATQHLEGELYRHQIETQTEPTSCLDSLRRQLVETRRLAASSSAEVGLVAIASGTIPTPYPDPLFAAQDRYLALGERFAEIARPAGTCGMHVHVGIDSPEEGVAVLDEIAMWLPLILALSVNSPFHDGRDTGYDSWRTQIWTRWPSAGPTSTFGSLEAYQAVSRVLRASGAALDEGMLYFDARLSKDHPTVEVRVSDVCTDVDDAVLIAALVRALVTHAADQVAETGDRRAELSRSDPLAVESLVRRPEILRAAQWRAARYGLSGRLVDPATGELDDAGAVVDSLVARTRDQLEEAGDLATVTDGLARLRAQGGASRQRAARERGGDLEAVVDDLIERSQA